MSEEFKIEHLSVGTSMGRDALVDAYVQIGPVRLRATLNHQGGLLIEHLHDEELRIKIGAAMRAEAIALITRQWQQQSAIEVKNYEARRANARTLKATSA